MHRKFFSLFLTLLLVGALAALAQSPTSSNTGGSETKDPYGATLDHPNPGSPNPARTAPVTATTTTESTTAATPPATTTTVSTTVTTPPAATTTEPTPAATPPATSTNNSSPTTNDNLATGTSTTSAPDSLPRTASELPLLAVIGLLALGCALMVRSIARREA
jgi:hypothetical protein